MPIQQPDPVRDEIGETGRRLSGGGAGRWIYIPTAAEDLSVDWADRARQSCRPRRLSMTRRHTWDRKVADSEAFVAPLRSATAVYLSGGRRRRDLAQVVAKHPATLGIGIDEGTAASLTTPCRTARA